MPLASWLFLRDSESIWVERLPENTMLVAGPGTQSEQRQFPDDAAVEAYQMALATRLVDQGWFLWGLNRDRRGRADRRGAARATSDRRRAIGRG
jgi:hypothetical protein